MADYPRVTHPCAAPTTEYCYPEISVRLACLIHAASVRSEPESNSPLINVSLIARLIKPGFYYLILKLSKSVQLTGRPSRGSNLSHNSIFKEHQTRKKRAQNSKPASHSGDKKAQCRLPTRKFGI